MNVKIMNKIRNQLGDGKCYLMRAKAAFCNDMLQGICQFLGVFVGKANSVFVN